MEPELRLTELGERRRKYLAALSAVSAELAEVVPRAVAAGMTIVDVARLAGISRPTVYAILKRSASPDGD